MNNKQIQCKRFITKAIEKFNDAEKYLIVNDLSERCICARFSRYLEDELINFGFEDYTVDVEYNRGNAGIENNPKMLHHKNIVVDLIVHKRGYNQEYGFDNLICIEMKKDYKRLNMDSDRERLRDMVSYRYHFCYEAGYMIVIHRNLKRQEFELQIESEYYDHY